LPCDALCSAAARSHGARSEARRRQRGAERRRAVGR
jgi:hypothetical protein